MLAHPFSDSVVEAMMQPHVIMAYAVELHLPSGISRAHSGTGELVINGHTFLGVGQFGEIGGAREESGSFSAYSVDLTLSGLETSLVGQSINERMRGRMGRVYVAVLGEDGKLLAADLLFSGRIVSHQVATGEENAVRVTLADRFEDWQRANPDRYTDESQQTRHPGDRIFRYVAQMAERAIYWGSKKDAPGFYYD